MATQRLLLSLVACFASFLAVAHAENFELSCQNLVGKLSGLANTRVYSTEYLKAGSNFSVHGQHQACSLEGRPIPPRVDICRVTAYAATSGRSGINFETWLPKNWTGRFISHGNGGLAGCLYSPRFANEFQRKQASSTTIFHTQRLKALQPYQPTV
jgi:feruloyl esterase